MAAPADYLDTVDLKNVLAGGLVREDVMQEIFDISEIPTPFLDLIGTGEISNSYTEWTEDELAAPDLDNAVISGSDASGATAATGARVGNHTQISWKIVSVTERATNTNNIPNDTLAYQTMRKMQELRRDVEAIALSNQASLADNNNNVAGRSAGFSAWLQTNSYSGAGGSAGGFNTTTKIVDAPAAGAGRALTWEMIADGIEDVYTLGGNPTVLMSVPAVTKRLGRYLFTTPYAASPVANVNGSGGAVTQTSQGYIDTFRTDFGFTMTLSPNRLQQPYDSDDATAVDVADVFGIDPQYAAMGYLHSYKIEPLAKLGLSHRRMISVDWSLKVYLERAHFVIRDILPEAAVVSGL